MRGGLILAVAGLILVATSESGAEQPAPASERTLVLLFDVSASMNLGANPIRSILATLKTALPEQDAAPPRIRVGVFASDIRFARHLLRAPVSEDLVSELLVGDQVWRQGPSRLLDAIAEAVAILRAETGSRFIVAVTDERTTGNRTSWDELSATVTNAKVNVSIISTAPWQLNRPLRQFVVTHGGQLLRATAPDPGSFNHNIVGAALGQYMLGMRSSRPPMPVTDSSALR